MWWLYDDAVNEFVDLFNSYEELAKLYAELSWDLRDLEELDLLNFLIILFIVTENNHNLILNQFK